MQEETTNLVPGAVTLSRFLQNTSVTKIKKRSVYSCHNLGMYLSDKKGWLAQKSRHYFEKTNALNLGLFWLN